jgi:hypothetical protein
MREAEYMENDVVGLLIDQQAKAFFQYENVEYYRPSYDLKNVHG